MKTRVFIKCILLVAFIGVPLSQSAQVFWEEDFGNGWPENWFTEDHSSNNTMWTWCADPLQGQGNGCPRIWDGPEMQLPFNSETSDNGFMTFDSDLYGSLPQNHIATLTTEPIDCSDKENVFLQFQSHIGIFQNLSDDNVFVRVSTNQVNWTGFIPYIGLTGISPNRWSDNPTVSLFDISDVAAGSPTVFLQWYWEGNFEFLWNIDDIKLYEEDPTLLHDLRVNKNFFAIPAYAQTPISQVSPMRFLADIENIGQLPQDNVVLNLSILNLNNGFLVYSQNLNFGTIVRDSLVENVIFPQTFTPDEKGFYEGTYSVSADSTDQDLSNNRQSFVFSVTDSVFSKSFGNNPSGDRPSDNAWSVNQPHSWGFGLHYQVPNGENVHASSVSFGIGNPEELEGEVVSMWLYEWTDENNNGDCEEGERNTIGIGNYEINGSESPIELITIGLDNIGGDGPIFLDEEQEYVVMMQFLAPDAMTDLEILTDRFLDYNAQFYISDSLDEHPKYHDFIYVGEPATFFHVAFGLDFTPDIRLNLGGDLTINTTEIDGVLSKLKYFPNPVTKELHVNVEYSEFVQNLILKIVDVNGKVLNEKRFEKLQQVNTIFDTSELPAGTYFIQTASQKGGLVQKFVVMRR